MDNNEAMQFLADREIMTMYYRLAVSILYTRLEKGWQGEQAGSDKPHILSYVNIPIYIHIQYNCDSKVSTGQGFLPSPLD
jgi:hypothetical protein